MTENKVYRSIDLFAGIGGIRMGFDRAFGDEIETVFASEWDPYAQQTYKANFDTPEEINGDITKIHYEPYVFENRSWSRRSYLHPIMQTEIDKGYLIQNPGW